MRMQVNMMSTLWDTSKDCLQKLTTMPFDEWYCSFPAQSVIMVGCIQWTGALTEALDRVTSGEEPDAIANYNVKWIAMIGNMVGLVRTQLTPLQRKTLSAKLTIDVHARDTNTQMAEMGVDRTTEFEWQKQLRYYWEEEADDCIIRQTNTRFTYGYEYLGNSMRLVITPLTDKCYMTSPARSTWAWAARPPAPPARARPRRPRTSPRRSRGSAS